MIHGPASLREKDGRETFSEFKHGLSSAMAFVMNRNFLFAIAAVILVALAACGKNEEEKAAAPADGQGEAAVSAPAETGSGEKGPDLVKTLRESAGVMTPEEKAAAVERARTNAEVAAKAVGQSAETAQAAGEAAAGAAQRSMDAHQPQ